MTENITKLMDSVIQDAQEFENAPHKNPKWIKKQKRRKKGKKTKTLKPLTPDYAVYLYHVQQLKFSYCTVISNCPMV